MKDLIRRQDAIDILATMQGRCTSKTALIQNSKIWQQIKDLPSADAVERKKGKWRVVSRQADSFTAYRCSECNELVYGRTDFCPNCGAEMKRR